VCSNREINPERWRATTSIVSSPGVLVTGAGGAKAVTSST
jgi:hypothetical protein